MHRVIVLEASGDHTIKMWDTASWGELATLKGHNWAVVLTAFSKDGKRFASGDEDVKFVLWDLPNRK